MKHPRTPTTTPRGSRKPLATMLRQLQPLVTNQGPRTITTISLSASERALLDEAARVHHCSRATVLRTGLPLAVAQLMAASKGGREVARNA